MTDIIITKALKVAAIAHASQKRKGTNIPYIIHPVGVMLIASEVTTDTTSLASCLLHDVLEDCDPELYSEADMLRDFGENITNTVKAVTKNESLPSWRERNEAYLKHLEESDLESAFIVCAADKIHNLTAVLADYDEIGDDLWERFNAGKDAQKWWYRSVLKLLQQKLSDNPLISNLEALVLRLEAI